MNCSPVNSARHRREIERRASPKASRAYHRKVATFPVVEVPADAARTIEQLGTKAKFWYRDTRLGLSLCKLTRRESGEDWAEKVAAELATVLGLPHAVYELAVHSNEKCVVSPNFVPHGCTLIHGNELLGRADPSYENVNVSRFRARAHTLHLIWEVLEQAACEMPLNWEPPPGIRLATDVFVAYLLLDALIGNTDRHHENWALIQEPEEATARRHLAPSFDHGSCLGCHLRDENRLQRLSTRDRAFTVEAYADKAPSAFYADQSASKPLSTMAAFRLGTQRSPKAAGVWLDRLRSVEVRKCDDIFNALPGHRCSEPSVSFARRLLLHNRAILIASSSQ